MVGIDVVILFVIELHPSVINCGRGEEKRGGQGRKV
jgi:hypothetical protein